MSRDENPNQEIDFKVISENIKRLRHEQNITCELLAERLDVSTSHIYKLESGKSKPSLELLFKMKNVFQCSFDDLVTRKKTEIKIPMSKNLINAISQMNKVVYHEFVDVIKKMEDLK